MSDLTQSRLQHLRTTRDCGTCWMSMSLFRFHDVSYNRIIIPQHNMNRCLDEVSLVRGNRGYKVLVCHNALPGLEILHPNLRNAIIFGDWNLEICRGIFQTGRCVKLQPQLASRTEVSLESGVRRDVLGCIAPPCPQTSCSRERV